jgi:hypothetical protein
MPSSPSSSGLDRRAGDLYRRYGAGAWTKLPEAAREHFRHLVGAGLDGAGRTLE